MDPRDVVFEDENRVDLAAPVNPGCGDDNVDAHVDPSQPVPDNACRMDWSVQGDWLLVTPHAMSLDLPQFDFGAQYSKSRPLT